MPRLLGRNSDVQDVTVDGYANVEGRQETFAANAARVAKRAFTIAADDPDPAAGEYVLWVYNNATESRNFIIDKINTWQVDADAVWRLWEVTGTGATAALIVAKNTYLGSAISEGDLTCRGGAGGVTGLTVVGNCIDSWGGGYVYNPHDKDVLSSVILEPGKAIAVEYDAGTTGRCGVTVYGHFYPYV
jgi:hypothetical protein